MTTQGYSNPSEQYKQAYSLKALMWLKEEFLGLEECFKLTHLILDFFARAMLEQRDSSIEQYLLTFWSKDLSMRDLIDRVQVSSRYAPVQNSEVFNSLFSWVVTNRVMGDKADPIWSLEDFRKVAAMLAQNVVESHKMNIDDQEMCTKFIDISCEKFGAKKVRDFMEIQLI